MVEGRVGVGTVDDEVGAAFVDDGRGGTAGIEALRAGSGGASGDESRGGRDGVDPFESELEGDRVKADGGTRIELEPAGAAAADSAEDAVDERLGRGGGSLGRCSTILGRGGIAGGSARDSSVSPSDELL